ncbi:MAG: metalloregulator ArsR/SmtB family transcription factor [Gammaproteobacteria bacterium]|nr:metalloregulator ArsR/SmtB family transcription factor [Gammaproteobacteria bacterium]
MHAKSENLDRVFTALRHPIRRAIIQDLIKGEKDIISIAKPHRVSLNAISKHLKSLEDAGIVKRKIDGNYHRISLRPEAMKDAIQWMTRYVPFWTANLESLKKHLEGK